MTGCPPLEKLHDFVDDVLVNGERRALALHLETCAGCRNEVLLIRDLVDKAAALSPEVEPSRDLWPEIARRIEKKKRSPVRFRILPGLFIPQPLAAAAVVAFLVGASSVVTFLVMNRDGGDNDRQSAESNLYHGRVALAAFESAETDYAEATRQLLEAYRLRKSRLSPETVKVIEENLLIIDEALRRSKAALEADPSNRGLSDMTAATYQKKIDFLRYALSLSS